jgi:dTMP kinase
MSSSTELHPKPRGCFITFEGGEGAGKSTQVRCLVERLQAGGLDVLATREPGGTPLAETYRHALLSGAVAPFGPAAEALVFSAARIDHLDLKIAPALAGGAVVVCDRFIDSTRAYQGSLGHLDPRLIAALERVVVGRLRPDLTFILDLPSEIGLARAAARRTGGGAPDRFEGQNLAFHEGLRRAFLEIAASEPERCCVVDSTGPQAEVAEAIWQAVESRLHIGWAV